MRFCSDKNASRGVLRDSVGVANSFLMINDGVKTGMSIWNSSQRYNFKTAYFVEHFYDTESTEQTRFRAPGLVGCKKGHYCKYRLQNHYSDKNNNHNIMQLGPFPGDLRKMTMIAFMYKHVDVLCLDTLSKQTSINFTFLNITKHWHQRMGRQKWTFLKITFPGDGTSPKANNIGNQR